MHDGDETSRTQGTDNEQTQATDPVGLLYATLEGDPPKGDEPKDDEPKDDEPKDDEPKDDEPKDDEPKDDEPKDDDKDSDKEDDGEDTISTASELVEHLEVDPEWFQNLKVDVKVDGAPAKATIGDLVKSYQIGEAADRRLEDAKERAQSITQDAAKKSEQTDLVFNLAAGLIKEVNDELNADVEAIDWNKLREDDSAEYAAKKQDVADRRARLEALTAKTVDAYNEAKQKAADQRTSDLKERKTAEEAKLLEAIPEWKDPKTAETERAEMQQYLLGRGFTAEEVQAALDHRIVAVARDAMLFKKTQTKVETAKKRLTKVPKVLKPGPRSRPKPKPKDAAEVLYG